MAHGTCRQGGKRRSSAVHGSLRRPPRQLMHQRTFFTRRLAAVARDGFCGLGELREESLCEKAGSSRTKERFLRIGPAKGFSPGVPRLIGHSESGATAGPRMLDSLGFQRGPSEIVLQALRTTARIAL